MGLTHTALFEAKKRISTGAALCVRRDEGEVTLGARRVPPVFTTFMLAVMSCVSGYLFVSNISVAGAWGIANLVWLIASLGCVVLIVFLFRHQASAARTPFAIARSESIELVRQGLSIARDEIDGSVTLIRKDQEPGDSQDIFQAVAWRQPSGAVIYVPFICTGQISWNVHGWGKASGMEDLGEFSCRGDDVAALIECLDSGAVDDELAAGD